MIRHSEEEWNDDEESRNIKLFVLDPSLRSGWQSTPKILRRHSEWQNKFCCLKVHWISEIHLFYETVNFLKYNPKILFCKFFHTFYEIVNFYKIGGLVV